MKNEYIARTWYGNVQALSATTTEWQGFWLLRDYNSTVARMCRSYRHWRRYLSARGTYRLKFPYSLTARRQSRSLVFYPCNYFSSKTLVSKALRAPLSQKYIGDWFPLASCLIYSRTLLEYVNFIVWVRSVNKMLPSVKFAEYKVLTFLILREKMLK